MYVSSYLMHFQRIFFEVWYGSKHYFQVIASFGIIKGHLENSNKVLPTEKLLCKKCPSIYLFKTI